MPCSRKYAPPPFRVIASSYAARWSSFCAGVNDRRAVGPPARGPGLLFLLMGLSSRTAINEGLDMVGLPDSRPTSNGGLALSYWPQLTLTRRAGPARGPEYKWPALRDGETVDERS